MQKYDHQKIEKKWQKFWEKNKTFEAKDDTDKEKFYALIEFPYPSGAGLHVGHPRPYTAMDIIARKKRMEGKNVLYPIGFDAFGLPTENYAIKTGRPPAEVTAENIANFTRQIKSIGFSFDWSRAVDTTDPKYYKWTQWLFLQFFKHGLAYKKSMPINWCPKDKIGLANEEVVDGKCERCGTLVEQRNKEQWMLAITKYAEKLLQGLKEVDYIPQAKTQQENWIGKSEGINIEYKVKGTDKIITVFTTRPDTNFGATFIALAPDGKFVSENLAIIPNRKEVEKYVVEVSNKPEMERIAEGRKKTGVFTGLYAINNLTGREMPVYVSDFVLGNVGTGSVVGVPGHDMRDFEFAQEMKLEIIRVVVGKDGDTSPITKVEQVQEENGKMVNSDFLNGLDIHVATTKIMDYLESKGWGKRVVNYKLRDWVFSRQRYWGEPIPLVKCEKCGWIPLPESELPLKLPKVKKYEPTDTGESPLAAMEKWVNTKCPHCGGPAKRETDTMPNWAGSSWYFLRYCDPHNDKEFASMEKLKYWMAVDWYNGGMEHTVLHLLYSRFWNEFLYDIGLVPTKEPYKKRTSHGMILAEDGEKMSKSRGNVVNPDEMVGRFGADAFRTYIAFMGPFDQACAWSTNGLIGVRRFIERVWYLQEKIETKFEDSRDILQKLHSLIKKVGEDIEEMHFNTAVAALMEFINDANKAEKISLSTYQIFLKLLAPFAPHVCEELWSLNGGKKEIVVESWPKHDSELAKKSVFTIAIQINGKVRDEIEVSADASEDSIKTMALQTEKIAKWLEGKTPKKVIYVKGRLVSIVI